MSKIRDFFRGYSEKDLKSLRTKLAQPYDIGALVSLTKKEYRVMVKKRIIQVPFIIPMKQQHKKVFDYIRKNNLSYDVRYKKNYGMDYLVNVYDDWEAGTVCGCYSTDIMGGLMAAVVEYKRVIKNYHNSSGK